MLARIGWVFKPARCVVETVDARIAGRYSPAPMESMFLAKRFVIVAGKGGVGKSTMCAALGLAAARAGKRTIIAELNTRETVPLLFGKPPGGYEPQEVFDGLFSMNIQPEPALHEYGLRKVRFERIYKTVFENEGMRRLLRMIPGMNELLLLGKAFDLERDRERDGSPTWDMIIVDAPATGHGVSLLRLPQTILEVIKAGPMNEEVQEMRNLLLDPERTIINLVTLPEEMPVRETLELRDQVDNLLQIPKGYLLINGVWPDLMNERDLTAMRTFREEAAAHGDPVVDGAMACLRSLIRRRRFQAKYLEQLRHEVVMPHIEVPFVFTNDFGFDAIHTLSDHIIRESERSGAYPARPVKR